MGGQDDINAGEVCLGVTWAVLPRLTNGRGSQVGCVYLCDFVHRFKKKTHANTPNSKKKKKMPDVFLN